MVIPRSLRRATPTTRVHSRLDQADGLDQLNQPRADFGTALIIITHNLGVVVWYADSVKIMYGGRIVEEGGTEDIFRRPHHPYTLGLIHAVPRLFHIDELDAERKEVCGA